MKNVIYWMVGFVLICNGQNSFAGGKKLLDRIVLHPSTEPEQSVGERKVLPSGLEVWIYTRHSHSIRLNQKHLFLIHFIGNASRAEKEYPEFLDLFPQDTDVEVWSVNYPGFGGSKGQATLASLPAAALDAFDNLAQEAKGSPIWVSTFSIGTLPGLYLAKERPVQAMILRNPVPLKELILRNYGWASWIVSQIPDELDSVRNAEQIHVPALFLSSENDEIVNPSLHRKVIDAYAGKSEVIIMPGAKHNDPVPVSIYPQIQEGIQNLTDTVNSTESVE